MILNIVEMKAVSEARLDVVLVSNKIINDHNNLDMVLQAMTTDCGLCPHSDIAFVEPYEIESER